jgi:hypothetical protein
LEEIFASNTVSVSNPERATAVEIYTAFMDTPPPPKVEARLPLQWDRVWRRLWGSGLPPHMVNPYFMLLHNILPLRARLAA